MRKDGAMFRKLAFLTRIFLLVFRSLPFPVPTFPPYPPSPRPHLPPVPTFPRPHLSPFHQINLLAESNLKGKKWC